MNAAIIAVGTELLGPQRVDTNSLRITSLLEQYGSPVVRKSVVPDDRHALADELRFALDRVDVVAISGGLGPTEDDITKEAVAEALGLDLILDPEVLAALEERFASRGMQMPETNRRQAMTFEGQRTLANHNGTAPGFHISRGPDGAMKHVWIFPGVPFELEAMLDAYMKPWLEARQRQSRFQLILRVAGLAESRLDEMLEPLYRKYPAEPVGIYAGRGELQIHLTATGSEEEARAHLAEREREVREIVGDRIYGTGSETLEGVVGKLLLDRGATVATAESCTGGLLSSRITDVSGSSSYFLGGVVVYTRDAKLFLVGVDPAVIDRDGEVSEEVARQLARGARRRFGADFGVGITGIAGPTGGSDRKPVGTVHIAVASASDVLHRLNRFPGNRELVKYFATQTALDMLRTMLMRTSNG